MTWRGCAYLRGDRWYLKVKGPNGWRPMPTGIVGAEKRAEAEAMLVRVRAGINANGKRERGLGAMKRALAIREDLACEACGWRPPPLPGAHNIMHAHHVVPRAAGGDDGAQNLALLCPNCHAVAHRLLMSIPRSRGAAYRGPETREALFAALLPLNQLGAEGPENGTPASAEAA